MAVLVDLAFIDFSCLIPFFSPIGARLKKEEKENEKSK